MLSLKQKSILAIIMPVAFLIISQAAFYSFSWWGLLTAGIVGCLCLFHFDFKYVSKIEDLTWQQQLHALIQKVSTPVIIADLNYKISFANNSLNRLQIATLAEKAGNVVELLAGDDEQLKKQVKETLDGLKGKVKCHITWGAKQYQCTINPLFSPTGKNWGFLLEFQANDQFVATQMSFENDQANIVSSAIKHTSHPLIILDESFMIAKASDNFAQLISSAKATFTNEDLIGYNIIDLLQRNLPNHSVSLEKALAANKYTSFVAEHFNQICDWVITPIQINESNKGYIVEIMYPSKQELLALKENIDREKQAKDFLEKELRQFTQGLANCKLYQKGSDFVIDEIHGQEYHHPLIKNSSKIMIQLYTDLHYLHDELDSVKAALEANSAPKANSTLPLKQINALSNALSKNVFEAEQDLTALDQELGKLRGLLAEQKGLNQMYMKPLSRALSVTEQALVKTVSHSETITLLLQQIHENQTFISQLQEFIAKLAKLPRNAESGQTTEIYQEIIGLLDRVKNTLAVGKLKLKELLLNFDGLNTSWKQAQENLQACLHSGTSFDQVSKRTSAMSNTAHDYSQLMQDKIVSIIDLTQSLQEKTANVEFAVEAKGEMTRKHHGFDRKVIEVDETKKKAEDVLLEGFGKY